MTERSLQPALQSDFNTQTLPREQRFSAWQSGIRSLFEVKLAPGRPATSFHAQLSSTLLDQKLLIARCTTSAQKFIRAPLQAASDGMDYYLIQTHCEGSQVVTRNNRQIEVKPGDLLVIDLAEPHSAVTSDFSHLSLVIPRQLLAPLLTTPDNQHCRVLHRNNPLTRIVVSHLKMLEKQARCIPAHHLRNQIDPTLSLLACTLNSFTDNAGYSCRQLSERLLRDIKAYLESHLENTLSVQSICAQFHVSRSTLYRLFEPSGGVRHYIQERRLRRSLDALITAAPETRIIDIAGQYGFRSEAHFSRAIRLKYGISPSSLRTLQAKKKHGEFDVSIDNAAASNSEFEQWLHHILKAV